MVGAEASSGIIRRAHACEAMACAKVPKIVLTSTTRAWGYYEMAGQGFDPDLFPRRRAKGGWKAIGRSGIFGNSSTKLKKKEGKEPDAKFLAEMEKGVANLIKSSTQNTQPRGSRPRDRHPRYSRSLILAFEIASKNRRRYGAFVFPKFKFLSYFPGDCSSFVKSA